MSDDVVFDIDLDLFLDRTSERAESGRLSDNDHKVWREIVSAFVDFESGERLLESLGQRVVYKRT